MNIECTLKHVNSKLKYHFESCDSSVSAFPQHIGTATDPARRLSSNTGMFLAAFELKERHETLSEEAEVFIMSGKYSDVAPGRLKFASVLYQYRQHVTVQTLIKELERSMETTKGKIIYICKCTPGRTDLNDEFQNWNRMLFGKKSIEDYTALCVAPLHKKTYHANFYQVVR